MILKKNMDSESENSSREKGEYIIFEKSPVEFNENVKIDTVESIATLELDSEKEVKQKCLEFAKFLLSMKITSLSNKKEYHPAEFMYILGMLEIGADKLYQQYLDGRALVNHNNNEK